ncbi:MAG: hypothetical protein COY58_02660 [Gammaproteobacteria bacterium CG_4_10_14_0_8_um_filter_38_16]|nr:MAG: hypothetical protein COY58_02660 [Gammaproteobacteria bacterium CG_4_10_14_0_8_um_filter_38_16]PJA03834.1 MAG: hypothetical protein COX72_02820 [Gammaproteobacteria bacterium CG_4_10_14_0_2_um_filter_38_22]PJB10808.1 MAG: hypothetical protein CO120_02925 [Gammaproteobacteria bacterium CG_4_9_14_3_um_filter_38_9]
MPSSQLSLEQLRRDPRTPLILTGIIAIIFIFSAWGILSNVLTHQTKQIATPATPVHHIINVSNLHLFGVYINNLENLPTTQLQLTLSGTAVSLNAPAASRALITAPGQPTKVYQVGDTIPGNATITRIAKHYVVLNDNGTLEKLALPVDQLKNNP